MRAQSGCPYFRSIEAGPPKVWILHYHVGQKHVVEKSDFKKHYRAGRLLVSCDESAFGGLGSRFEFEQVPNALKKYSKIHMAEV